MIVMNNMARWNEKKYRKIRQHLIVALFSLIICRFATSRAFCYFKTLQMFYTTFYFFLFASIKWARIRTA